MSRFILIFFVFYSYDIYSQIIFTEFPLDYQLYGRNLETNYGEIKLSGEINYSNFNYEKISALVKEMIYHMNINQ